jgi:membrane protease YdiL (CAAX protease family)
MMNRMQLVARWFLLGLVWAAVYRKTHSLRWTIIAHLLADLPNPSILVFLNIVVPFDTP